MIIQQLSIKKAGKLSLLVNSSASLDGTNTLAVVGGHLKDTSQGGLLCDKGQKSHIFFLCVLPLHFKHQTRSGV